MNVFQRPLDHGGRAVAIVQTDLLEVSNSLGDAADGVRRCGDFDIVKSDCVDVVGGSRGGGRAGGLGDGCLGC